MSKKKNYITPEIVKEYGMDAGASVVGIASVDAFGFAPAGFHPTDVLPVCRSVIVFGSASPQDSLLTSSEEYSKDRSSMIVSINGVASKVEKRLKGDG